jgi:mono/diheme cytochrome c family protein
MRLKLLFMICAGLLALAHGPVRADDLQTGKDLFNKKCGICHGERGGGTWMIGRRLGPEQAMLDRRDNTGAEPLIRYVVRWGLQSMPRFTRVELPDSDLDLIVRYLLAAKPQPATVSSSEGTP